MTNDLYYEDIIKTIANNFGIARSEKGLTMKQIGEICGLSKATVSKAELPSDPAMTMKTFIILAKTYGKPFDFYFRKNYSSQNVIEEWVKPSDDLPVIKLAPMSIDVQVITDKCNIYNAVYNHKENRWIIERNGEYKYWNRKFGERVIGWRSV